MTELPEILPGRTALPRAAFDDDFVVLDAATAEVHLLEGVTAVVFDACDGETSSASLLDEFTAGLHIDRDAATSMVGDALTTLGELGLLLGSVRQGPPPCIGCRDPLLDEPVRRLRKSAGLRNLGSFAAMGFSFRLEAVGALGEAIHAALADLVAPPRRGDVPLRVRPTGAGKFDVEWGDRVHARGLDEANALAQALISVNYAVATAAAGTGDAVLHAGAIEIDHDGVAFAGSSGAGKSTLVAGAAQRGYAVIADEVTAIDPRGNLRPYHRPIGLRADGAAALGLTVPSAPRYQHVWPRPASELAALSQGAPLRLVVFTNFRPGPPQVDRWSPARSHAALVGCGLGGGIL